MPAYKRILLKLSGEALMGDDAYGINRATIVRMVREVQEVTAARLRGGGRHRRRQHLSRRGRRLGRHGPRHRRLHGHARHRDERAGAGRHDAPGGHDRARDVGHRHRAGGRALRAAEGAAVPRGGQGRGLRRRHRQPVLHHRHRGGACAAPRSAPRSCSRRPRSTASTAPTRTRTRAPRATRAISFDEAISRNLQVMDATAFALCRDQKLPIKVFSHLQARRAEARGAGRGRGHAGPRVRSRSTP